MPPKIHSRSWELPGPGASAGTKTPMWISKERSRVLARRLLHTNDTPERTSLAFAVGFGIAFSPFIGFHTVIALALAFALKLNRLAVIWGTFANNPYTLVPIVTF